MIRPRRVYRLARTRRHSIMQQLRTEFRDGCKLTVVQGETFDAIHDANQVLDPPLPPRPLRFAARSRRADPVYLGTHR